MYLFRRWKLKKYKQCKFASNDNGEVTAYFPDLLDSILITGCSLVSYLEPSFLWGVYASVDIRDPLNKVFYYATRCCLL